MTIKGRIGKGLVGILLATGLTGVVAGTSSCTTAGEAWGRGVAGSLAMGAAGAAVDESVRTGIGGPRGTTVINNHGNGQPQVSQQNRGIDILTGNSYRDMNGDGIITSDEVINSKNTFTTSEGVFSGISMRGYKGHKLDLKFSKNGIVDGSKTQIVSKDYFIGGIDVPKGGLSAGAYTIEYSLDGSYLGTTSFEIR